MRIRTLYSSACLFVFLTSFIFGQNAKAAPNYTWIESESPSTIVPSSIHPNIDDDGRGQYLSGGKWIRIAIDADQVSSTVPSSGIILTYSFSVSSSATYQIWNRLGFELIRSNFDWRVDNGSWSTVKSTDPTTDIDELQTWNPIGWLDMGSTELTSGSHLLQIRVVGQTGSDGKPAALLYSSDAICVYAGNFTPNDQYRPDDMSYLTSQDRSAASKVFQVTRSVDGAQTPNDLSGQWLVARDDEQSISDPSGPIAQAPVDSSLYWKSMAVPGNRDSALPEWLYAHRYWLRTKISVPARLDGNSFVLHFPSVSMIATVFVNGVQCGYTKAPFADWDCDITKAVKVGQANELEVGIKDWFYALPDFGAKEAGHLQYIPTDWVTKFGPANFTFPVWNHTENGILQAPSLVVGGPVYTSDVFARPSVRTKSLSIDVTLQNSSASSQSVTVDNSVIPVDGGDTALTFPSATVATTPSSSATTTLTAPFPNAKLWWPDSPFQYNVVTTISIAGKVVDRRLTKFGFRQWDWSGSQFVLNGVPWHGRADLVDFGRADDDAVATWHKNGQTMVRMWGEDSFSGLSPDRALDYFDEHGIVVRRTGIFDGEAARYQLTDGNNVRQELFENWQNQLLAWAKGERNHPSIFIWSIENEIAYVNARVTGTTAIVNPAERTVAAALQAIDPTRPVMTDGGNALLDQSMPVYGCHYIDADLDTLPNGAYDEAALAHRQDWPMTQVKPIIFGESFYANGDQPADLATVGGDSAFLGKVAERPAIGLAAKMYSEGLRWSDISFHFWIGGESDLYYRSWQPVAVLCRQWDWTFGGGQSVLRILRIFNDTHDSSPITLLCKELVGSTIINTSTHSYDVPPGGHSTIDENLVVPQAARREEGTWLLSLLRAGQVVFTDTKPFSILPKRSLSGVTTSASLAVYDPAGTLISFLQLHHAAFTQVTSLATLPKAKVLVIGKDALASSGASTSALTSYAASGHSVIILEQTAPAAFSGLTLPSGGAATSGDLGFIEDSDHPAFNNLLPQDFFTWGDDGSLYTSPYVKPASGARALIACGNELANCALAELNPGSGTILVCQLDVEGKIAESAAAQQLLVNLIRYGASYKQIIRQTTVVSPDDQQLTIALDDIHLNYTKDTDPVDAISKAGQIAVIDATPANLTALVSNVSKVNSFTQSGGWIILNNLTPEGISPFDQLVGFHHIIRPFHQEKVTFSAMRNDLTLGLSPDDIVMGNGQNIFGWEAGQYPDQDAFSYVVDLDDIAPFCSSVFGAWDKIVNGYTQADGYWPLIINFPAPTNGQPFDIPITLQQPETITQFTFVGNNNYWPQTKLNLEFGPGDSIPLDYDHGDVSGPATPETYAINPPRTVSSFTLEITAWDQLPNVSPNIGIDNIYITVKRPVNFNTIVKPMLNIGALVEYPKGTGGIVLCNVKFKDPSTESNHGNTAKKEAIIETILRNLDAQFISSGD